MKKLIGPFTQILPLSGLPLKGALIDEQLLIIPNGGVLVENGLVVEVGDFEKLRKSNREAAVEEITGQQVLLPGFVDCHTHLCFAGDRSKDYALRIAGKSYLEIAKAGGGIWDSVTQTRLATKEQLAELLLQRIDRHVKDGVTTIEVKSGYGLKIEEELKQLSAIKIAIAKTKIDLVPTCLAAHILPKDFGTRSIFVFAIAIFI